VKSKDASVIFEKNDCDAWIVSIVVTLLFPYPNMPRKKIIALQNPLYTDNQNFNKFPPPCIYAVLLQTSLHVEIVLWEA